MIEGLDIRRQKELGLNLRKKEKNSKAVEELVDTEIIIISVNQLMEFISSIA